MEICRLKNAHIPEFIKLFRSVFTHNQEVDEVDLMAKLDTSYAGLKNMGFMAKVAGSFVGAMGLYPVLMNYHNTSCVGAQVGDAMIKKEYRKQGLFTRFLKKAIEEAQQNGIEVLFSFPSLQNRGSYKSMLNAGFKDVGPFYGFVRKTKPSLYARIMRRLSKASYKKIFHKTASLEVLNFPVIDYDDCLMVHRSSEYYQYKKFKNNGFLVLRSGTAWVSFDLFNLGIGDFLLHQNYSFPEFCVELESYASRIGKDYICFYVNHKLDYQTLRNSDLFQETGNLRVMIYYVNEKLRSTPLRFTYADIDTF